MIERRLAESLLFLETSRRSAGDREYIDAIRKLIAEHAQMRDALEQIGQLKQLQDIHALATNVLQKSVMHNSVGHDLAIHEALVNLERMLPGEEEMQKLVEARRLIRRALRP